MAGRARRGGDLPFELIAERPGGSKLVQPVEDFEGAVEAIRRLSPFVPDDATWSVEAFG